MHRPNALNETRKAVRCRRDTEHDWNGRKGRLLSVVPFNKSLDDRPRRFAVGRVFFHSAMRLIYDQIELLRHNFDRVTQRVPEGKVASVTALHEVRGACQL